MNNNKEKREQEIICRFERLNIKQVELSGLPISVQNEIVSIFETIYADFPILQNYISKIEAVKYPNIEKNTQAITRLEPRNGKLFISIILNYDYFQSFFAPLKLKWEQITRYATGTGLRGVIAHELGHVLHYILDIKRYVPYGLTISHNDWLNLRDDILNDITTKPICDNWMQKLGITERNFVYHLSKYGGDSYRECVAEAISEYYTRKGCRVFALNIYQEIKSRF